MTDFSAQVNLNKTDVIKAKALLIGIKNGFPKAMARAINNAASGSQRDMINLARDRYNYKVAALRSRIKINRATWSKLSGSVVSTGKGVHLSEILGTRQTAQGVSVDVKKSTGRRIIPQAFKSTGRYGTNQVIYIRERSGIGRVPRTPTDAIYAPHPETVYNTDENWNRLQLQAKTRLDEEIGKQIDTALKGY